MLTIIYLDGMPNAAVRFKSGAAEMIGSINLTMSQTMLRLISAKRGRVEVINSVVREQVNNPAIERFYNHRENIPINEPHHRIDETGLTSLLPQSGGDELLNDD